MLPSHLHNYDVNTAMILPFVPYTPKSLARLLRRRITSYVATATRQISASTARFPNHPFVSMIVTNRSIHPNAHRWSKFRVDPTTETLEMRTSSDDNDDDDDGNSSTTIEIWMEGASDSNDQTPTMAKLYAQLHRRMRQPRVYSIGIRARNGQYPSSRLSFILKVYKNKSIIYFWKIKL